MSKLLVRERCIFCSRPVIEHTERLAHLSLEELRNECGEVIARVGARVGGKPICKGCCSELVSMIPSRLDS